MGGCSFSFRAVGIGVGTTESLIEFPQVEVRQTHKYAENNRRPILPALHETCEDDRENHASEIKRFNRW